ncbi:hypothetical protein Patl1_01676 [Pistacia atlantica]|uniref:Uncharacterized protein n=1 Tax=Pistacia atlantica TaxID=434234 RepID=A0ACC1CBI3_9ROSI|nr:hypothetical protein Patl1_01676 [Pistacia atlantica]
MSFSSTFLFSSSSTSLFPPRPSISVFASATNTSRQKKFPVEFVNTMFFHFKCPHLSNLLYDSSNLLRRFKMSSDSLPPLPENRIVVGCGGVGLDFLAAVASYPKPDDKIRSTSLKVQGGGNAGNALTCAARLGLNPRIISKVADDPQGKGILEEFEADGVDTSFLVVSKEGNSPFTYVIVDKPNVRNFA